MTMDPSRTINGSFGQVFHEGEWVRNFTEVEASVEVETEDIQMSGSRWTGTKVVSLKGTGRVKGKRVDSKWLERIGQVADDTKPAYMTELTFEVNDPEAYGAERIRLKNVTFTKLPLQSWSSKTTMDEEYEFNFVGYDLLDKIEQ